MPLIKRELKLKDLSQEKLKKKKKLVEIIQKFRAIKLHFFSY